MEESWEDLLCRVYYAGYEDRQRERDYDPKSAKVVHTAKIRADLLEQHIRELESWIFQAYKEGYQDAQNDETEGFDDDWMVSMAKMIFDQKMEQQR